MFSVFGWFRVEDKEVTSMDRQGNSFQILASGSSGNATVLQHGETNVLLDMGISLTRTKKALRELGLGIEDLDGVVITHEHSDHIKGLEMLVKYHPEVVLYASKGTQAKVPRAAQVKTIERGRSFEIGSLSCHPYATQHDANEPLGFRFEGEDGARLGWATDLGYWDDETAEHLEDCHVVMIEANHDPDMLWKGPYPSFLKRRVSSRLGHLSNVQAMWLLDRIASPSLQRVILGHLSEKNNDTHLALRTVSKALSNANIPISVAERKSAGPELAWEPGEFSHSGHTERVKDEDATEQLQASLF